MKSTGIVRKVDRLGRIVIPMELRETLSLAAKEPVEIFTDENTIILKGYKPTCFICGNKLGDDYSEFKGRNICSDCVNTVKGNK